MTREEAIEMLRNNVCNSHHVYDNALPTIIKALETLIPELTESEDERIRMALVEYFAPPVPFTAVRGMPIQKIRDWLEKQKEEEGYEAIPVESTLEYKLGFKAGKKSEKQKEQKSAEWSEEDDKMRNLIIETLDDNSNYFPFKETKKKMMDWLKSLRPSWKPSEEQMEAIRLARSFVVDDFDEHPTLSEILMELEEQLKELI